MQLISTWILQRGLGGLFLQEGEAEPPALIEETLISISYQLSVSTGIGTFLHPHMSPSSAPWAKKGPALTCGKETGLYFNHCYT